MIKEESLIEWLESEIEKLEEVAKVGSYFEKVMALRNKTVFTYILHHIDDIKALSEDKVAEGNVKGFKRKLKVLK